MKKSKGYISHPLGKKHGKSKIEEFLNQKLLEDKVLLSSVPLGGWKEIMLCVVGKSWKYFIENWMPLTTLTNQFPDILSMIVDQAILLHISKEIGVK